VHYDAKKRGKFMNRYSNLLVLGLMTFLTTQAFAQSVVEKDWVQDKKIHELTGVVSCAASTAIAQSTLSVVTEIILPENDEKIPLIVIKVKGLKGLVPRAHVRPDAKTQYPMLLLKSDIAANEDTFVLSPMRMPEVLDIIAAKNTLDVYFGEGATAILARISLKGSAKTITRTASCRIPKVLWKERLFKDLKSDPQLATPLNGSVQDLLASFQKTLDLINLSEKTQAALAAQIKASQAVVAAEKQAGQILENSEKSVLDTQNQISSLQRKIADLRNAIAQAQVDLPQLQSERPQASQNLVNAQNALRNVETEVRRLQGEVELAQNRENQIASNLNSIQSQISSLQYQLSQQQSQVNSLRQDQNSRYNQLNSLQATKNQLDQNYKSFDVNRRIEQILYNNSTYMSQYNSLPGLNNRRNQLNSEIPAASNLVKELTRAVKDCQAGPGNLTPGGMVPPACDAEKARLATAQKDLNNKQNELNKVNRKISDTNNSIANYQAQARQQAINERDRIATDLNNTNQRISQLQSDINVVDRQINNLVQIDIPRTQNDLYSKKSDLSITQNSLAQAQSNTRYAQANLVNYKNSVGYDRLVTNVRSAESRLTSIDQRIAQAQSALSKGPAQIAANETEVINQQNLLVQRQAAAVQAKTNLTNAQSNTSAQQVIEQDIRNQLSIQLGDLLTAKRSTQGLSKALYGF
jgi:chromosome segregation ATPase